MNVVVRTRVATGTAAGTFARWLRFVLDGWRRITLKQVLVVNGIALLVDVWYSLTWLQLNLQAPWQARAWIFGYNAVIATGMLLVVAIADRVAPRRWPWWMPYAIGALVGGLLVNLLTSWCFQYVIPLPVLMDYYSDPEKWRYNRTLTEVVEGGVACGVALFAYAWLRRLHLQQNRLHAVQQEQVTARRRLAEARLQTIEGRVEPELLIDTLARIEALQGSDATRALRALDALIVYLRAAIPRGHVAMSTLGGEIALVRAYLDVLRSSRSEAITLEADLPPATAAAVFPAMVLPCVIRHDIAGMAGSANRTATVRVEADLVDACLQIRISDIPADPSGRDDGRIESLRERLAALYGDRARFARRRRVKDGCCHVETVIEIPQ